MSEALLPTMPRASTGDIDPDGQIVGALMLELRAALGEPDVAEGLDLDEHLTRVAAELVRVKRLRWELL